MAAQTGGSAAALRAAQAALATQQTAAADADRAVAESLAGAYAAAVAGIDRLDAITAAVDAGVAGPAGFATDTALGAREFQKFLIDKQREVIAVVSAAGELDRTQTARLEALRSAYSAPAPPHVR
jgi:hypothetical protein